MSASASGIRAGRAFVELFADDSKLVRGLKNAQKKLEGYGKAVRTAGLKMMAVGGALVTPLLGAAKVFASIGDNLVHVSERTGISVEALSELSFAADQCGVDMEGLETGIRKMQKTLVGAAKGSSEAQDALKLLGLTWRDLDGLKPQDQFKLIADRLSKIEDPTVRAAAAMQVFGRSGTSMLPMIAGGAAGIDALCEQARALGLTISTEDAEAAHGFSLAMEALVKVLKHAVFVIGSALAPLLKQAVEWIMGVVVKASAWIKQNQGLIVTVFQVGVAILAAGAALVGLGYVIGGVGSALGVLATVFTTVGGVLSGVGAIIGALLSPIGLVVAAVAGLGAYFLYSSGAMGEAVSWLGETFNGLVETAKTAFGAISKALAAGDIGLAAKVLWTTLKMYWEQGVGWLSKVWADFKSFFVKIAYEAFYGAVMGAEYIWHGLEVAWIETTAFLSQVWYGFVGFFAETWEKMKALAKKAWVWIKSLFDDSIDTNAAYAEIDQQKQAAISAIEDEQKRKSAAREAEREAQRRDAAATHNATMAALLKELDAAEKSVDAEHDAKVKAAEDAVAAARTEWQSAVKQAQDLPAPPAGDKAGPGKLKDPAEFARNAQAGLAGVGDLLNRQDKSIGTFNPMAFQSLLQGDSQSERIAKATEETAKQSKKTAENTKSKGKFT